MIDELKWDEIWLITLQCRKIMLAYLYDDVSDIKCLPYSSTIDMNRLQLMCLFFIKKWRWITKSISAISNGKEFLLYSTVIITSAMITKTFGTPWSIADVLHGLTVRLAPASFSMCAVNRGLQVSVLAWWFLEV